MRVQQIVIIHLIFHRYLSNWHVSTLCHALSRRLGYSLATQGHGVHLGKHDYVLATLRSMRSKQEHIEWECMWPQKTSWRWQIMKKRHIFNEQHRERTKKSIESRVELIMATDARLHSEQRSGWVQRVWKKIYWLASFILPTHKINLLRFSGSLYSFQHQCPNISKPK